MTGEKRRWIGLLLGVACPGLGLAVRGAWVAGLCCFAAVTALAAIGWADAVALAFDDRGRGAPAGALARVGPQAALAWTIAAATWAIGAWAAGRDDGDRAGDDPTSAGRR